VSQSTVHHWVHLAQGQWLDQVDWHDRPHDPKAPHRTAAAIEALVLAVRGELGKTSDLGFHGAEAIHQALKARQVEPLPSVRTINRIVERRGALDGRRRQRHPAPPPGWHLPEVVAKQRELDSFDVVEGLVIKGGPQVEVLNGISLHGGLAVSWPMAASVTAKVVVESLIGHWRAFGLPGYAQFDNDTIFQGPHAHPDVVGRVSRLCLGPGVTPVFVVPREFGFQSMVENYNGTWQAKVWARFEHGSLSDLQACSDRYVTALRHHRADRIESAPGRRDFPKRWRLDLQSRPRGRIIYVRRTDGAGAVEVLGRRYGADEHWLNRLVRVEVDLDGDKIRIYRLRRREPMDQPQLKELGHHLKLDMFKE
jgi:hypothetical protein